MDTANASPRPWCYVVDNEDPNFVEWAVFDEGERIVAAAFHEAIAKRIVDAVNERDALREENDRLKKHVAEVEEIAASAANGHALISAERARLRDIVRRFIALFDCGVLHPAIEKPNLMADAKAALEGKP